VNGAALLAPLIALYTVAVVSPVRQALLATVAMVVPLSVLTAVFNPLGTFGGTFRVFPLTALLALAAGIAVANRRGRVAALQARARRAAGDPFGASPGRRGGTHPARARPECPWLAGGDDVGRRTAHGHPDRRDGARLARGRRSRRLPDRPGVADQRAAPRRAR